MSGGTWRKSSGQWSKPFYSHPPTPVEGTNINPPKVTAIFSENTYFVPQISVQSQYLDWIHKPKAQCRNNNSLSIRWSAKRIPSDWDPAVSVMSALF